MHQILKTFLYTAFLSSVFISCKCDNGPTDNSVNKINPYIKEIKFSNSKKSSNYYMAVWREKSIFAISAVYRFDLDKNFLVIHDSILLTGLFTYIDANNTGTKLLLGVTTFEELYTSPTRVIYEYELSNNKIELLYGKTRNVGSARYFPGDDTKIVYYSFGDSLSNGAGYYLLDKNTNQDTLLFPYLSTAGIWETLHGFDIHPSGKSLLVPIERSQGRFTHLLPPKIGVASLEKQKLDTLAVNFDFIENRTGVYLRYNKAGNKILYSCYPNNAYGYVTNGSSEVGIIETATLTKKILDINTNTQSKYGSVQLAPNWSPDETAIVYGSGNVNYEGMAGDRGLYILTKIE